MGLDKRSFRPGYWISAPFDQDIFTSMYVARFTLAPKKKEGNRGGQEAANCPVFGIIFVSFTVRDISAGSCRYFG